MTDEDCIVTREDHREGLEYMRRTQFYKTLCQCITKEEEEEDDP